MDSNRYFNVIRHHGVLGMKWGVRKDREATYRKKLTAISKNENIHKSDRKRIEYRNNSLAVRVGGSAASGVSQMLIKDIFSGNISQYHNMSKAQIAKKLTQVATHTIANVAINDALAKSASERYSDTGHQIKGNKDSIITKEDAIVMGVQTAVKATRVANVVLQMKMAQAYINKAKNEEIFNRWGTNILTDTVDNVVWQSEDFKTAIIDNRKR